MASQGPKPCRSYTLSAAGGCQEVLSLRAPNSAGAAGVFARGAGFRGGAAGQAGAAHHRGAGQIHTGLVLHHRRWHRRLRGHASRRPRVLPMCPTSPPGLCASWGRYERLPPLCEGSHGAKMSWRSANILALARFKMRTAHKASSFISGGRAPPIRGRTELTCRALTTCSRDTRALRIEGALATGVQAASVPPPVVPPSYVRLMPGFSASTDFASLALLWGDGRNSKPRAFRHCPRSWASRRSPRPRVSARVLAIGLLVEVPGPRAFFWSPRLKSFAVVLCHVRAVRPNTKPASEGPLWC